MTQTAAQMKHIINTNKAGVGSHSYVLVGLECCIG